MKNLAAYYRPQTFAQVTGQSLVTTVLSRAAAEDKVAPAYLLSGTRGVGKTTIARILAKALNCEHAPAPEPCNQCEQCRRITQGNHVDVTEIDGASNNGVEDARALRETIGYAPMEGRYKVFIIDEAHMLSRAAFNALLKTLEEPPPRVVFIFATTEAHKFPITIVSRCQHFIFKRLPEATLVEHLTRVLQREEMPFDPQAVRLIARRAAGSVRDGMSLLGQTLALGVASLTVEATRNVLGLAGQEVFFRLSRALQTADFAAITGILREILDQGADITYFLREFTAMWRTLFLLQQGGAGILPSLDITAEDLPLWQEHAQGFSLAHIHAAWHMVLEAQRKISQSPEPAAALELLLFNVALIPRLLPLEQLGSATRSGETAPLGAAPKHTGDDAPEHSRAATPPPQVSPASQPAAPASAPAVAPSAALASAPAVTPPVAPASAPPVAAPSASDREGKAADAPGLDTPEFWEALCREALNLPPDNGLPPPNEFEWRTVRHSVSEGTLLLATNINSVYQKCAAHLEGLSALATKLARDHGPVTVRMGHAAPECKTDAQLLQDFSNRPEFAHCRELLGARVVNVKSRQ